MANPPDSGSVESAAERLAKQMAESGSGGLGGSAVERLAKQMAGPDMGGLGGSATERIAKQMAESGSGGLGGSAVERLAKQMEEARIAGSSLAKQMEEARITGLGGTSSIAKQMEEARIAALAGIPSSIAKQMAGLGISDNLRASFGRTAALTTNLGDALANVHAPPLPALHFTAPEVPDLEPLRNPILDTNRQLAELSETTRDLVGIAHKQAELSQSLAETSRLVLLETIRSGRQAKFATWLAAAGIIATLIIATATMYFNYHQSQAAEAHFQHEIQVLQEISQEQRAADRRGQDEVRTLGEILRSLQNPKKAAPNTAPPNPKAPPAKVQ